MKRIRFIWLFLLLSLPVLAAERPVLHLPANKLGKPVLACSRIIDVNRTYGKVFAPGQGNPFPQVMHFQLQEDGNTMLLVPEHEQAGGRGSRQGGQHGRHGHGRKGLHALPFHILEVTGQEYVLEPLPAFTSYPEALSAIPGKMLPGPAREYDILEVKEAGNYFQIDAHYLYSDGLDVTAACYLIFLREEPMPVRSIAPRLAGYNSVTQRLPEGGKRELPHRWALTPGRTIDFYVDKAFPESWYPYIKEGIEDWNQTFEAIGLGQVLQVHPEPEGLGTTAPLVNMVRYMDVEESNAKGDVLIDPRSGEILRGDILWWKNVVSLLQGWRYLQTGAADPQARQENYPIEILGPLIRHAVCHEMGHVLGLSHNMGASWAYPADSLRSVSFTRRYGTAASVMDYARYNHLATAADIAAGVNLLPPRIGPYDYYAIAMGYGAEEPVPGPYCYFAPFISAAISPDPSAQPESLGNDLLRSSQAGLDNCRALLSLDGLTPERKELIRKQYYRYISLALSNIGGTVCGIPVSRKLRRQTLRFVLDGLSTVPPELSDPARQQQILDELVGNFLPKRILDTTGEKELKRYYRELRKCHRRYRMLPLKDEKEWKQPSINT